MTEEEQKQQIELDRKSVAQHVAWIISASSHIELSGADDHIKPVGKLISDYGFCGAEHPAEVRPMRAAFRKECDEAKAFIESEVRRKSAQLKDDGLRADKLSASRAAWTVFWAIVVLIVSIISLVHQCSSLT